jgi:hypothetical protein
LHFCRDQKQNWRYLLHFCPLQKQNGATFCIFALFKNKMELPFAFLPSSKTNRGYLLHFCPLQKLTGGTFCFFAPFKNKLEVPFTFLPSSKTKLYVPFTFLSSQKAIVLPPPAASLYKMASYLPSRSGGPRATCASSKKNKDCGWLHTEMTPGPRVNG